MAAEFAAVVPAVILLLVCCLAGLQLAAQHLRLQDATASAARSVARGDDIGVARQLMPGARFNSSSRGDMVCVNGSTPGSVAGVVITVTASSCAFAGGK
ncbi:TadE family type IV pilus minor pilin [Glaciihabitans sp. UYNi722]|uniref:TadE family type IV pilus minor pilin n=1 Tax=Glaciihabitans sp. UYNi722 TaxID=3156344 RepID=UPI003397EF96